jgi:hypothetical protein
VVTQLVESLSIKATGPISRPIGVSIGYGDRVCTLIDSRMCMADPFPLMLEGSTALSSLNLVLSPAPASRAL